MNVTREYLLTLLPAHRDLWVTVKKEQVVRDIIREMVDAYPETMRLYDEIGCCFEGGTVDETCDNLYDFCVNNIRYRAEGVDWQSSPIPQGVLTRGEGDCKTYAAFIGGCLGAINRARGGGIDWAFRFVSYEQKIRTPYHVFIVVFTPTGEIWVDPTPGADIGQPKHPVTKRVDHMALMREIAGVSVNAEGDLVGTTTGDPSADTALAVSASISNIINQQNLRGTYLGNWLSDFANPGRALSDLGHLLFGYKYTGGDYALGEIFIDRVLNKQTYNRWDVPDAVVPVAWYYFTELFGIPIAVNTDLDTLINSGSLQDYLRGRPEQTGYVTEVQVERAHQLINMMAPHDKYGQWPPEAFSLLPYVGPIPDARRAGGLFTGTLPNGQSIVNGYPVSAATKGGNISIATATAPPSAGMNNRLKTALLIAAVGFALWWVSENE